MTKTLAWFGTKHQCVTDVVVDNDGEANNGAILHFMSAVYLKVIRHTRSDFKEGQFRPVFIFRFPC